MAENTSILVGKSLYEANQIVNDMKIIYNNIIINEVRSIWQNDENGNAVISRMKEPGQLHVNLVDNIINGIFY